MGWKDLLYEKTPEEKLAVEQAKQVVMPTPVTTGVSATGGLKFPTASVVTPVIGNTNCEPHMSAVMDQYEKGFESLNQPGVEFYEYFKSVSGAGIDNPTAYTMAFNMLRSLEPTLTKEKLNTTAQFYLAEIDKVHQKFDASGKQKIAELENGKRTEDAQLRSELALLEQQQVALANQIAGKNAALNKIESKYAPEIEEVGCKLAANDVAKTRITGTIQTVINGINTNL
jgi:hypothetical protein